MIKKERTNQKIVKKMKKTRSKRQRRKQLMRKREKMILKTKNN